MHFKMIKNTALRNYTRRVLYVHKKLSSSHLTALSLWSDFIVYVDNGSAGEIEEAMDSFGMGVESLCLTRDLGLRPRFALVAHVAGTFPPPHNSGITQLILVISSVPLARFTVDGLIASPHSKNIRPELNLEANRISNYLILQAIWHVCKR